MFIFFILILHFILVLQFTKYWKKLENYVKTWYNFLCKSKKIGAKYGL